MQFRTVFKPHCLTLLFKVVCMECTSLRNFEIFNHLPLAKQLESLATAGVSSKLGLILNINGKLRCLFRDDPAFSNAYRCDSSPSKFYDAGIVIVSPENEDTVHCGVLQIQTCDSLEDKWYGSIFMKDKDSPSGKWKIMQAVTSLEIVK